MSPDGYLVNPAVVVPPNAVDVIINESGQIYAKIDGEVAPVQIGQMQLANFANESGLEPLGGNLYRETLSSGVPVVGFAGDIGYGKLHQRYLENSNVDPVKEITELISAQRSYEMNSKVIQAADEMASTVSKGLR